MREPLSAQGGAFTGAIGQKLGPTLEIPMDELAHTGAARGDGATTLAQLERESIMGVLEEANWLIAGPRGAAARLGMKRDRLLDRRHP